MFTPALAGGARVCGVNLDFVSCAIRSTGVKLAQLKSKDLMYHTDESDLGNSDNPPSMGGQYDVLKIVT
ncbi:MAG TPA: hypothetical protein PLF42_16400 [Anaerolineales bacterium]|nr:hypothetical protein [Anaerolineales bacterium]